MAGKKYTDKFIPTGRSLGEELLRPHRSYRPVLSLMEKGLIKGCAHITGGGFQDNVDRILPTDCNAVITASAWRPDPIFEFLQNKGNVETDEMYHTFNMGVAMVLAVDPSQVETVMKSEEISAFGPVVIGNVVKGSGVVVMEY